MRLKKLLSTFSTSIDLPQLRISTGAKLAIALFITNTDTDSVQSKRPGLDMECLRTFFRRPGKSRHSRREGVGAQKLYEKDSASDTIGAMRVAGMQRSNQGTFVTSYTNTPVIPVIHGQNTQSSSMSDSSKTAVDTSFVSRHGESQWKGKPNGRPYDRREELSPEDEDMWAKMSM